MKVTVKESKLTTAKLPTLMKSLNGLHIIIAIKMTEEYIAGTTIMAKDGKLGEYCEWWARENFIPFKGKVTIEE